MVRIQIDLDGKDYASALTRKGRRTWRSVLLSGLDIAHDNKTLGRPHGLDKMYKPVSERGGEPNSEVAFDDIYVRFDKRQKEHRAEG